MKLQTDLAGLRSFRPEDAESLARHGNDEEVARQLRTLPHPYSRADATAFIEKMSARDPQEAFAIVVDGEAVGAMGIHPGENIQRAVAELGYWLGREHWGCGIVSSLVPPFCRLMATELGLIRIHASVFDGNPGSARVLEKCGFEREAVFRRSAIQRGKIVDMIHYAWFPPLLNPEAIRS